MNDTGGCWKVTHFSSVWNCVVVHPCTWGWRIELQSFAVVSYLLCLCLLSSLGSSFTCEGGECHFVTKKLFLNFLCQFAQKIASLTVMVLHCLENIIGFPVLVIWLFLPFIIRKLLRLELLLICCAFCIYSCQAESSLGREWCMGLVGMCSYWKE
jgi:hypothetical protein